MQRDTGWRKIEHDQGRCQPCWKLIFTSRRAARKMAGRVPGERMDAYRCPHNEQHWHVGYLPHSVRSGIEDRDQYKERQRGARDERDRD